jgi:hypothetical protein
MVQFEINDSVIAGNMIHADGSFTIRTNTNSIVDVYYSGIGGIRAYLMTIEPAEKDTVFLNFSIPKIREKKEGRIVCPKCGKTDKILPISYGLKTLTVTRSITSMGDTIDEPVKENFYDGGCSGYPPLSAAYFCERDSIPF